MTAPLGFSCGCGALKGHVTANGVRAGTHVVCYCADCRASERFFQQPDPAPGPVDIFQLSPETVVIDQGTEHLAAIRLSPNGMFRWYANCCNTPICTTLKSAKTPFAGMNAQRFDDPGSLGPVVSKGFVPAADGSRKHESAYRSAWPLIKRMAASRLSGRWKNTPFFDADSGAPVVEPRVIDKAERKALYI
ncbi:hypothetical protein TRL7639_03124 [Falsiruegeria litorea R37]|uniref:CENP-V/GFA domain-containing protein n=1 Tax=Falsiruegeria litorea R37 TaxID=1200284 RepID=A0A1Y5T7N1_9RHOB|nr:DUF6151 family protein [Falsiruegeria litorea]SLN57445.1 hypothetical protein TRL7639_03124 [Falsiruegeria litorea R37]